MFHNLLYFTLFKFFYLYFCSNYVSFLLYFDMKFLVTGASGFVGSHLVDLLLEKNQEVFCIVRNSSNLKWLENKNITIIKADLSNKDSLKDKIPQVDYIYHVAGRTFGSTYDDFYLSNCIATKNLLDEIKDSGITLKRFVYLSSQTASGPSQDFGKPIIEADEPRPITSYGKSKLAGEKTVAEFFDDIPITVLRATAIYGPRDNAILPVFQSVKYGLGTLIGFNEKYISLLHVKDIVRGIYEASLSDNTVGKTYFLTSKEFYSWKQIINVMKKNLDKKFVLFLTLPHFIVLSVAWLSELFGKIKGKPPVFNYEKGIDFIQNYWTCSHLNAKNDFGFEQEFSIDEGIENTVKWYKKQKLL